MFESCVVIILVFIQRFRIYQQWAFRYKVAVVLARWFLPACGLHYKILFDPVVLIFMLILLIILCCFISVLKVDKLSVFRWYEGFRHDVLAGMKHGPGFRAKIVERNMCKSFLFVNRIVNTLLTAWTFVLSYYSLVLVLIQC